MNNAYDNGSMACKYGFPRDACHRPLAYKLLWQQGWDDENSKRAARASRNRQQ